MIEAAITSKGQVTIPKKIRETLHIQTGDKIGFILSEKGEVIIRSISKSVDEVFGLLSSKKKNSFSIDEMNNELGRSFSERKI
ncbi:MAG: AbrB/MazE/SpoVT family DNA-binding domain-containing protein [Calditrichaeota bacterium]|nr:MAG: AbrB/MazE/SpoVT family DNA-binding domain-containing protein [Calditrichota bacterium]MBL1204341.1 AbrB/MazE/SpoVT family DNA-binding domain-containing protein [Calditrichota bacterium]NOG44170.1 AbrB/MazE/SpoVT family DNA-binding domain-containing protein [Calditrichota bacterium]